MTQPNLINKDRTWKSVICLNPDHATVSFDTNEIGTIRCPLCESPMVTITRTTFQLINETRG